MTSWRHLDKEKYTFSARAGDSYMNYRRRKRYKRRFNPKKGLMFFLLIAVILLVTFFVILQLTGTNLSLSNISLFEVWNTVKSGFQEEPGTPIPQGGTENAEKAGGEAAAVPEEPSSDPSIPDSPNSNTATPNPPIGENADLREAQFIMPIADPMPPPSTDPEVLKTSWRHPSVFDASNAFLGEARVSQSNNKTMNSWLFRNAQLTDDPGPEVFFGSPEFYSEVEGVLTFRGNNFRDAPSAGSRAVRDKRLEIVWEVSTGSIPGTGSYWPGTGWTGQPLLVRWPESSRNVMNLSDEARAKDLVEVIYPALDGNIYFLDLETGQPTRGKMKFGFPFKGTGMIDPRGYPLLYVGQGLNENGSDLSEFRFRIIDLINQTELYSLFGRDPLAFRPWGAFDSSGLIDASSDTLLQAGENGLLYKVDLNTKFESTLGFAKVSVAPHVTKYRYHLLGNDEQGIESSPAAWRNFLFFADNGGTIQSLNLNTMEPVWFSETGDDTDSTLVIEENSNGVFLYAANTVDKRSLGGQVTSGYSNIRKYDATTGRVIWQRDIPCIYQSYINGGAMATPLIGKDDISDLIIFNIALTGAGQAGKLIALDKNSGETVWERELMAYSWSSPVGVLCSESGKTYAILAGFDGMLRLFDPRTGKDLHSISLGGNIESSPAVFDDMIVVGSYAKKIFGVRIK